MQQGKDLPCHKSFVKCLATSCVGSVINVTIDVKLQDIIPKCLGYLLRLQKMQYTPYVVYVLPYLCKQPYDMPVESGLTGGRKY